jgi:hypothetical protein
MIQSLAVILRPSLLPWWPVPSGVTSLAKKPSAYLVTFSNGRIARKDPRLSAAIRASADAPHARY